MGYGILNGSLGVGAVIAATVLARIRRHVEATTLLTATSLYYVFALVSLALVHNPIFVICTLLGAGFAWTSSMSTLNVSVQLSAPGWVAARALGVYLMTFQGGMALGSVVWGAVAQRSSVSTALLWAAACMAASLPFLLRIPILKGTLPDLTPYRSKRPVPTFAATPDPEDGPVRISIDYRVQPENLQAFTEAIYEMKGVRLRDGAIRWAHLPRRKRSPASERDLHHGKLARVPAFTGADHRCRSGLPGTRVGAPYRPRTAQNLAPGVAAGASGNLATAPVARGGCTGVRCPAKRGA